MLQKNLFAIIFTVIISVLSGCSETTSKNEFVGTWIQTENPARTIEIRNNGENFIIKRTGGFSKGESPATLKDGILVTPDLASFFIDKSSGNLKTGKGVEYKRAL